MKKFIRNVKLAGILSSGCTAIASLALVLTNSEISFQFLLATCGLYFLVCLLTGTLFDVFVRPGKR